MIIVFEETQRWTTAYIKIGACNSRIVSEDTVESTEANSSQPAVIGSAWPANPRKCLVLISALLVWLLSDS